MLKKTISFAACAFIALASCNSIDPIEDGNETDDIKSTVTDSYDYYAENLGMAVHKAIADSPQARQLIKEEVMKKFDGDYDLLLSNAVSLQVDGDAMTRSSGTVTFGQLLESYIEAEPLTRSSESFLDELMEKYPDMQISVPVHADEWDPQTYTPDVAIIPSDYVEFETETLPAIDAQGNDIEIDAINEPDVPVIVVSRSERLGGGFIEGGVVEGGSIMEIAPSIYVRGIYSNKAIRISYNTLNVSQDNIVEMRLMRTAANSNSFSQIAFLDKTNNQYVDWNISEDKEYAYYIQMVYTRKDGSTSQVKSKTIELITDDNTPNPVQELLITPLSNHRNCITWKNNPGEDYPTYIYRTSPRENEVLISKVDPNEDSYYDQNVVPGEQWFYVVKKFNPNTGKLSASSRSYIYNPFRNPEALSPVMLKKIIVDVDKVEAWAYGAPEFHLITYGVNSQGENVQFGSTVNVAFDEHVNESQDLNCLLYNWHYFEHERFYPTININMVEYDGDIWAQSLTLGVSVGIKFKELISMEISGSITFKFGHSFADCGVGQMLFYEHPTKTITLQSYDSRIYVSDVDRNQ